MNKENQFNVFQELVQKYGLVRAIAMMAFAATPEAQPVKSKPGETAGAAIARAEENKRKWNQGGNNS